MLEQMSGTEISKALNKQTSIGWTPLLIACNRGHMELVNTMLNNHARVDVFDQEGRSALHLAAEHGYLKVSSGKFDQFSPFVKFVETVFSLE
jgi:FOG: Ankyrin repeat